MQTRLSFAVIAFVSFVFVMGSYTNAQESQQETVSADDSTTIRPMAFDDGKSAEVHEVKVKDQLNLNGEQPLPSRQRNIHRIKSLAAFERLGGKNMPVNFDKRDLVIVNGWLGCAEGKVEMETAKQFAIFSVNIVRQCNHPEAILCLKPYVGHFAVGKNMDIAPYVFIKGKAGDVCKGEIGDLLKNTNATHLELNRCGVTDAEMAKLKEFKKLRHLQLSGNKITDQGLANLTHLTNLVHLYLDGNQGITDAGLEHLRDQVSSNLQELGISGTSVTRAGLEKLRAWSKEQKDPFGLQISHSLVTPQIHD